MRKHVIALLVLFTISAEAPQKAEAGAFATEVTQLLNHAQLVLAYIRQGLQLENELAMYANMLRNTKNLSPQTFGQIQADINALAQIVQGGQALAYSLGNLDQLFRVDISRLRHESDRLLHELSEMVADLSRHNARSAPRRRTAKPANAE